MLAKRTWVEMWQCWHLIWKLVTHSLLSLIHSNSFVLQIIFVNREITNYYWIF
jgi:hypothetical protein